MTHPNQKKKGPNWKTPLILSVTLTGLFGLAIWSENIFKPQKEKQTEAKKKPMLFDSSDEVESVRIFNGQNTVLMTCLDLASGKCKQGESAKWEINIPAHFKADDQAAGSLLTALHNLSVESTVDLASDADEVRKNLLKDYKLDTEARKPAGSRQIEVKLKGGKSRTIYLGDLHPSGDSIFGLRDSDEKTVYLLPNYFKSNFEYPLSHWRDKSIFDANKTEVTEFQIEAPSLKVKGAKKDNQWTLDFGDGPITGDIEAVDQLINGFAVLNAKDFVTETKGDSKSLTALKGANRVLKANFKTTAKSYEMVISSREKPQKMAFAEISTREALYEIEQGSATRLLKKKEELRFSKLITNLERFTIKTLDFEGPSLKEKISIQQKDNKWFRSKDQKQISDKKIQSLFDALSGNRIKEYLVASRSPGSMKDGITVTLSEESTPAKRKYAFWKHNDTLYSKDLNSKRDEVFKIDANLSHLLPWTPDFFDLADVPSAKGDQKAVVPSVIGQSGRMPHDHASDEGHEGHEE